MSAILIPKEPLNYNSQDVSVHYQPIVCNQTKKIVKYEALMRLGSVDEPIYPITFMRSLKKIEKLYNELSISMLTQVCRDLRANKIMVASINVSMLNITNIRFCKQLFEEINKLDNKKRIVVEFTETDEIDFKRAIIFLNELKGMGVQISMDDFGAGYSNFKNLVEIDFDYIKIDGDIVKNIVIDKNKAIVDAIVGYSKQFNIPTIAEHVENVQIYNIVREMGVEYSQGYYFGKPERL